MESQKLVEGMKGLVGSKNIEMRLRDMGLGYRFKCVHRIEGCCMWELSSEQGVMEALPWSVQESGHLCQIPGAVAY